MIGGIRKIARCDYIGARQENFINIKNRFKIVFYLRGYNQWQNMIIW